MADKMMDKVDADCDGEEQLLAGLFDEGPFFDPTNDPIDLLEEINLDDYDLSIDKVNSTERPTCETDAQTWTKPLASSLPTSVHLLADMAVCSSPVKAKCKIPRRGQTLLSPDFEPSPYTIFCGRGKEVYNYSGKYNIPMFSGVSVYHTYTIVMVPCMNDVFIST